MGLAVLFVLEVCIDGLVHDDIDFRYSCVDALVQAEPIARLKQAGAGAEWALSRIQRKAKHFKGGPIVDGIGILLTSPQSSYRDDEEILIEIRLVNLGDSAREVIPIHYVDLRLPERAALYQVNQGELEIERYREPDAPKELAAVRYLPARGGRPFSITLAPGERQTRILRFRDATEGVYSAVFRSESGSASNALRITVTPSCGRGWWIGWATVPR